MGNSLLERMGCIPRGQLQWLVADCGEAIQGNGPGKPCCSGWQAFAHFAVGGLHQRHADAWGERCRRSWGSARACDLFFAVCMACKVHWLQCKDAGPGLVAALQVMPCLQMMQQRSQAWA